MNATAARVLGFFSSLRLAVVCLCLLFILVFWGTLYQVDYGLYAAKQRFFDSWVILILGVIPFPGTALVLWVFFVNLFLAMMSHFQYGLKRIGIILLHAGLLLLLVGGWITHLFAEESYLTLAEGESSNVSASYHDWEISVWTGDANPRQVTAADTGGLKPGDAVDFGELGFTIRVEDYFRNSQAFSGDNTGGESPKNSSGIVRVEKMATDNDPERNLPAGVFTATPASGAAQRILLFGGDPAPTRIGAGGREVDVQLRRKRYELPVKVTLLDFKRELHPNTRMAKSYSSKVKVSLDDLERDVLIQMNEPFRHQAFTFFQASFSQTEQGGEVSTFAVTRNVGRLIPYVATGVVTVGLIIHFMMFLWRPKKRRKTTSSEDLEILNHG